MKRKRSRNSLEGGTTNEKEFQNNLKYRNDTDHGIRHDSDSVRSGFRCKCNCKDVWSNLHY